MSYELFLQGPEVVIPVILISLIVTLVAYGAFPLIFARTRKQVISKKRYNILCYSVNFLVMMLFIVINGQASSGNPYLLWTWVFSASGCKTMKSRGVLEGFQSFIPQKETNKTMEQEQTATPGPDQWLCTCGKLHYRYESSCVCGKSRIEILLAKVPTNIVSEEKTASKEIDEQTSDKISFCRKCGSKLPGSAVFCGQCGTKITKE